MPTCATPIGPYTYPVRCMTCLIALALSAACGTESGAEAGDIPIDGAANPSQLPAEGGDVPADAEADPVTGDAAPAQPSSDGGPSPPSTSVPSGDGCAREGWQSVDIPWSTFRYQDSPSGGFTVCHPPEWSLEDPPSVENVPRLRRFDAGTGTYYVIQISGELRLDHEDALCRVRQSEQEPCAAPECTRQYVEVGGWPALYQRYAYVPPACGQCGPDQVPVLAAGHWVAADLFMVSLAANLLTTVSPEILQEIELITRSVRFPSSLEAAVLSSELSTLQNDALPTSCLR